MQGVGFNNTSAPVLQRSVQEVLKEIELYENMGLS